MFLIDTYPESRRRFQIQLVDDYFRPYTYNIFDKFEFITFLKLIIKAYTELNYDNVNFLNAHSELAHIYHYIFGYHSASKREVDGAYDIGPANIFRLCAEWDTFSYNAEKHI